MAVVCWVSDFSQVLASASGSAAATSEKSARNPSEANWGLCV